jgi:signal transduction histidine kinase
MKAKFLIVILLLALQSSAQNHKIDSLLTELPKAKNDTIRARIYIRLQDNLRQTNPEKALLYGRIGLRIVQKMKWNKGLSVFYNDIGNTYLDQGKHKEALANYLKSLDYSEEVPTVRALTLQNISIVYFKEENIPLAIKYNNIAIDYATKENITTTLALCNNSYGDIYAYQKDNTKAKLYYIRALALWTKENNRVQQAVTLMHLGEISTDISTRIDFYKKSKSIWDSENPSYLLAVSNMMGLAEDYIALYKNDSLYKIAAQKIPKEQVLTIAENYLNKAVEYSKQSNIQQNLMFAYGKLSELEEVRGNYKKALDYINLNYEIYISIFSQENKNKIAAIENQKAIAIKNQEIELKIKEKQRQKEYFLAGLFFVSCIGFLLFYQSRNRKKINQKLQLLNLELANANKAKTRFFSILNHDLRSPVSNLIDFLHLQKNSPDLLDDETKKRIGNTTLAAAENLLMSMEDILQWSKSQMENFKPQPKDTLIADLFNDTRAHFSVEKKVKIIFENANNIQINTDENYLKTIIRNLTENAIKALDGIENPTILWKTWQGDSKVFLSISDNGKGASNEVFKALYNDNEVVGIKTGLGLHLIRDLAKAINCNIIVDSKQNEGTTITMTL